MKNKALDGVHVTAAYLGIIRLSKSSASRPRPSQGSSCLHLFRISCNNSIHILSRSDVSKCPRFHLNVSDGQVNKCKETIIVSMSINVIHI